MNLLATAFDLLLTNVISLIPKDLPLVWSGWICPEPRTLQSRARSSSRWHLVTNTRLRAWSQTQGYEPGHKHKVTRSQIQVYEVSHNTIRALSQTHGYESIHNRSLRVWSQTKDNSQDNNTRLRLRVWPLTRGYESCHKFKVTRLAINAC